MRLPRHGISISGLSRRIPSEERDGGGLHKGGISQSALCEGPGVNVLAEVLGTKSQRGCSK